MTSLTKQQFNQNEIVKELDALIRLYDVTEIQRLNEKLEPKWWESGLRILLFISGLGFLITVYKLIPAQSPLLFGFVFGWFFLFVLSVLGTLEFLLSKTRALSRLYHCQTRLICQLVKKEMTPNEND